MSFLQGWSWGKIAIYTVVIILFSWFAYLRLRSSIGGEIEDIPFSIPSYVWYALGATIAIAALAILIWAARRYYSQPNMHWLWSMARVIIFAVITGSVFGGIWYLAQDKIEHRIPRTRAVTAIEDLPEDTILAEIARCESNSRQFDDQDKLVENPDSTAVGKYQIIASLHEEEAKKLGYNIRTEEGNEAYARVLLRREGLAPWQETRWCWGPALLVKVGTPGTLVAEMVVGRDWSPEVKNPLGYHMEGERLQAVAYQAMDHNGIVYDVPRVLTEEERKKLQLPLLKSLRLRVTDMEMDSMKVQFRFTPLK